jgi:PAS domain S-box-containing protein
MGQNMSDSKMITKLTEKEARRIIGDLSSGDNCELVAVYNGDGRYLYASSNHKVLLGYNPADLIGLRLTEIIHPDDLGHILLAYNDTLLSDSSIEIGVRLVSKDFKVMAARARAMIVTGPANDSRYIVGICRVNVS